MKFDSFEQAMQICLASEDGSPEQDDALIYCMENAPPDLKKLIMEHYLKRHQKDCGCGCKH